jgi:uncharacterized membrane protein (UPF0127 family)
LKLARKFPIFLFVVVMLFSCSGRKPAGAQPVDGKPQAGLPVIALRSGDVELTVELARSDQEKNIGLMYRRELADGKGMLFVYTADQMLSYWMKNTYIPLSIAYLSAEGEIREIYDMVPLSLAPVSSTRSVRYALEVPQGWFERAGLKPGDRFEFPAGFPAKP